MKTKTKTRKTTRPKRTRLSPEKRHAQLLKCAVEACADMGIARVTHADIAERAGVSVPTVFVYFSSRENLVDAVLDEVANVLSAAIRNEAEDDKGKATDQVVNMVWACAALMEERPDILRVWLDWSTAIGSPVWKKYLEFQKEIINLFANIINKGKRQKLIDDRVSETDAARVIIGQSHMLAMLLFEGSDIEQTKSFVRHYVLMSCHYAEN